MFLRIILVCNDKINQNDMEDIMYKLIYQTEQKNWWYRVRRIIIRQLINKYKLCQQPKILDVGCGTGLLLKELEGIGKVHGIDNSSLAVSFCKTRGISDVKQGDATNIPFDDCAFDIVLALDILEHVKDDYSALKEIRRVVKKQGVIIIFVPAFKFLWGKSDKISRHYRRYAKKELINLAGRNNLSILRFSYFNFFLFVPIALLRMLIRIFRIKIKSENDLKFDFINSILYGIFWCEAFLLKYTNFPFGVSMLLICKK